MTNQQADQSGNNTNSEVVVVPEGAASKVVETTAEPIDPEEAARLAHERALQDLDIQIKVQQETAAWVNRTYGSGSARGNPR